jgi:chorismate mutase/prephenate dehydratase
MDIAEIRNKINEVDKELLEAFVRRMRLSEQVASHKSERGLPVTDKTREREVLRRVQEEAGDLAPYAFELFHTLIGLSKAHQHQLFSGDSAIRAQIELALENGGEVFPRGGTVACQGVEGANSQAACDKLLPLGNIVYVRTFEAVFDAVESGLCQFGVLPIENSANGSVRAVYELLQRRSFYIVRSTNLHIRHELLANPGAKLSDIREVYSHEQALGQCSKFLASLEGVRVIPCGNTAEAAKAVAESGRLDCAAISSHACAGLYGLCTVADRIQDSENNYTRFICITKKPMIYAGANKISLILSCENEPGSLYGILSKLAARGLNMSKLESYAVTGRNFEFSFFIDIDASVREPGVPGMLEELENTSESCIFLGNYSVV